MVLNIDSRDADNAADEFGTTAHATYDEMLQALDALCDDVPSIFKDGVSDHTMPSRLAARCACSQSALLSICSGYDNVSGRHVALQPGLGTPRQICADAPPLTPRDVAVL